MKINRLFEIVYILLNKKTITAKELAEHFEVSQRTIYRDIDILSTAGIPIYTSKGKGGGISLLDDFVLNKSLLSEQEQTEILSALQSLDVIAHPEGTENVLSKLSTLFNKNTVNWIETDFSDWGYLIDSKFDEIKFAIFNQQIIQFDYYSTYGEKTSRRIEPISLWFKHNAWYVKAFCLDKLEARIFKLSRMKNVAVSDEHFAPRDVIFPVANLAEQQNNKITLKLQIDAAMAFRVYDEFEEKQIVKNENGSFTVTVTYPEDEWVYGFILSFGHYVKVLEPEYAKGIIIEKLQKSLEKYC